MELLRFHLEPPRTSWRAVRAMKATMDQNPSQIKPNPTKIKPNPNQIKPNPAQIQIKSKSKSESTPNQSLMKILEKSWITPMKNQILGSPRTSFVVPRPPRGGGPLSGGSSERRLAALPSAAEPDLWPAVLAKLCRPLRTLDGRASGARPS